MKIEIDVEIVDEVLKEAFWLAWTASQTFGLGVLQANPDATKEDVWSNIVGAGDYPGPSNSPERTFVADYVFGRMMKLAIWKDAGGIEVRDEPLRLNYQSCCYVYPTYESLIEEAKQNVLRDRPVSTERTGENDTARNSR